MLRKFVLATAAAASLLACSIAAYAENLKGAVVVTDLSTNAFQIGMADLAVKYGKEMGADVTRYAPEGSFGDYAGQISIIENLITKKVDFIILVAGHPTALGPVVKKATDAGIGVINIDNRLNSPDVVAYVGVDNALGAKMAVDHIAAKLGDNAKIGLIMGETSNPVQILRTKGFDQGVAAHPGLKVVARQGSHWTEDHGLQVMSDILQANPDIQAVFCESDNLAIGAIRALASANRKDVMVVGFDGQDAAYKAILDGTLNATIRMDAPAMLSAAVKYAIQYAKTKSKDGIPPETYSPPEVVTSTNVAQYYKK